VSAFLMQQDPQAAPWLACGAREGKYLGGLK
jgi:hypothetical protein